MLLVYLSLWALLPASLGQHRHLLQNKDCDEYTWTKPTIAPAVRRKKKE